MSGISVNEDMSTSLFVFTGEPTLKVLMAEDVAELARPCIFCGQEPTKFVPLLLRGGPIQSMCHECVETLAGLHDEPSLVEQKLAAIGLQNIVDETSE